MGYRWGRWLVLGLGAILLSPAIAYGGLLLSRPSRTPLTQAPFVGIEYQRQVRLIPRPLMVHVVRIDLHAPGVAAIVTPPRARRTAKETRERPNYPFRAQTTSDFLETTGVQLAVNGSFFFPFHTKTPWDYYPHTGEPVAIVGQSIVDGAMVSPPRTDWGVLCIGPDRRAAIVRTACPPATRQALAGRDILLAAGRPLDLGVGRGRERASPRTVVATSAGGDILWLIVIDGRQPGYSEGATLKDLSAIARELGATAALNLDGGGSATLAISRSPNHPRAKVLNSPIHTRIPRRERPVANHLGIYARPLPSQY